MSKKLFTFSRVKLKKIFQFFILISDMPFTNSSSFLKVEENIECMALL